ncbi:hypothetical protein I3F58_03685 [Streptomyces sp. MUM 203J]|uniref:hypothetical protein n=1 Tax=Streptomyces sp. MUM 203J TaxID=2791990 RepID=UPI001F0424C0|nr:hypothetical protein [Streptomyces sp. MUM 203J]MCH0538675.1 hypothetical protein [Streptomyces sp. MUM 203J]
MTTPSPTTPCPPSPGQPYDSAGRPLPVRPGKVVAVVVAFLLVLVGGAVAWWAMRDGDGPFAGRPRVNDGKAGLSYAIPEGWQRNEDKLLDAFTSAVTGEGPGGAGGSGGSVLAGRAGGIPQARLKQQTERAAYSNAEFFCPDGGKTLRRSEATAVGDRPAHTVVVEVTRPACGTLHLRMTIISVDDDRSAFLIGLAQDKGDKDGGGGQGAAAREEGRGLVDAVIADAALTR